MAIAFAVVGMLLLALAVLFGFLAVGAFRRASLLNTPQTSIANLQPGFAKVRGRVVAVDEPLRSPVTGKKCVYYRLRAEGENKQWRYSPPETRPGFFRNLIGGVLFNVLMGDDEDNEVESKVARAWVTLLDDSDSGLWVVEDATGAVEVDLRHAEIHPKDTSRLRADVHHPAPDRLQDLLRKRFRLFTMDERGRVLTMQLREDLLREGAKVTVVGPVEARRDGTLCFRAGAGRLLVSERDPGKQGREASLRAIGFGVSAATVLMLALALLFLTVWRAR